MAPKKLPLRTRWAEDVDRACPLPDYPRPQLRRERWQNLNGVWSLAVTPRGPAPPAAFPDEILVPFPVESALSGVERAVLPSEQVWYRRGFDAPTLAAGERLLLHFGAVDWGAKVFLNGRELGSHRGGHVPFHFDITDALAPTGPQELVVSVWDPTDQGDQPLGKQSLEPFGIQYTAVTGIWQTVWLEPVPATRVERVSVSTSASLDEVTVRVRVANPEPNDQLEIGIGSRVATSVAISGEEVVVVGEVQQLRPWTPDDPFLNDLTLRVLRNDETIDEAASYFGARHIETRRDSEGVWRLFLNGEPIFHLGLLDQGWWPDGLYTAPTDEALAFDIEATKRLGFNTIRKHVKVEPARWYWHADRLGVLVWQDMPSPRFDQKAFAKRWVEEGGVPKQYDLTVSGDAAQFYRAELHEMLDALEPFACIQVWVPFNEAWGQHETDEVLASVAKRDPTRVVDGPSGWQDTGSGAIRDYHDYAEEIALPPLEDDRPIVLGEFGGLKLATPGHMAVDKGWGYQQLETAEALEASYRELLRVIADFQKRGLAAAIYTQTTDVESELNGLLTYDREVFKIAPDRGSAARE